MTAAITDLILAEYADKLEVPGHLITYLYDEFLELDDEDDTEFGVYIAQRISESVYLSTLYHTGDVDGADEISANIFCEICDLLGVDFND